MSRKRQPEHVNHERWLVSYADFITLLFAFFVVLFASSKSDHKKQLQAAAAMQKSFADLAIFDPHSKQPPLIDSTPSPTSAPPSVLPFPSPTTPGASVIDQQLRRHLAQRITQEIAQQIAIGHIPSGSVTLRTTPDGLVISLHDAGFFTSGSASVRPTARDALIALAHVLPASPLRVEGHTDNIPIHTPQFPSNWELSTSRATAIARILLEYGTVNPASLSAAGYAEFHPIASNATPAGRLQNRRVDIICLHTRPR